MKKPERKYLTAVDAAEYIGYTPNTLSQYRSKKIGVGRKNSIGDMHSPIVRCYAPY